MKRNPLFFVMGSICSTNYWRLVFAACAMLTCLSLEGCDSHVKWQEEVQLRTGEIIVIDRDVRHEGGGAAWPHGQGSVPMEHTIRFQYPPKTGPVMEWRSTKLEPQGSYAELPLVLDISEDNTWFIFTNVAVNSACTRYSKYQFHNGAWSEAVLAEDIETHTTNLFLAGGGVGIEGLITLAEKDKEYSSNRYFPDIKKVGPKKYSCVGGYIGPYPPIENPPDCKQYPGHPACRK